LYFATARDHRLASVDVVSWEANAVFVASSGCAHLELVYACLARELVLCRVISNTCKHDVAQFLLGQAARRRMTTTIRLNRRATLRICIPVDVVLVGLFGQRAPAVADRGRVWGDLRDTFQDHGRVASSRCLSCRVNFIRILRIVVFVQKLVLQLLFDVLCSVKLILILRASLRHLRTFSASRWLRFFNREDVLGAGGTTVGARGLAKEITFLSFEHLMVSQREKTTVAISLCWDTWSVCSVEGAHCCCCGTNSNERNCILGRSL